ncbi:polygalacturonase-like [Cryptomeria japonica]|uniref:polygalacturonase-like n=1 Tax=Cryptomeria japonica TaxID=3369 RepID=UPI0027DA1406|nr:polygalacturonase-like [Cryptomeria japonica]
MHEVGNGGYSDIFQLKDFYSAQDSEGVVTDNIHIRANFSHIISACFLHLVHHNIFSVLKYGAKADGKTDDSTAFLAAWNAACSSTGSPVVYVPKMTFLINPVIFQGPCHSNKITMQVAGKLIASTDNSLWSESSINYWLHFMNVIGLTVEGSGILDGRGASWWTQVNGKKTNQIGPTTLRFTGTVNTIVRKITSVNSKQFHINFDTCNYVEVEGVTIKAPGDSPNTDGIHVGQSSNVQIRNIIVGTGDDCISIGPGSFNVDIEGVTCGPGHGISIGSLGEDNALAAVKNITVKGVSFHDTQNGVRIKTWQGGNGFATDITFQNVKMDNVQNPVIIDQYYSPYGSPTKGDSKVKISNVLYKNITGTSATNAAIAFECSQSVPCEGIKVDHINLSYNDGKTNAQFLCKNAHVTAVDVGAVSPTPCL